MAPFTSENAAEHGRRGGQQSHRRLEEQYADLVLSNPSAAGRVAELIRQGYRLVLALRVVKVVDRMNEGDTVLVVKPQLLSRAGLCQCRCPVKTRASACWASSSGA